MTQKTQNTANPLVYNNMGWLGDGSHRGQGCQTWTAVGLPPRYPQLWKTRNKHTIDGFNSHGSTKAQFFHTCNCSKTKPIFHRMTHRGQVTLSHTGTGSRRHCQRCADEKISSFFSVRVSDVLKSDHFEPSFYVAFLHLLQSLKPSSIPHKPQNASITIKLA